MENVHEVQARVQRFMFKRLVRLIGLVPLLVIDPRSKRGVRHSLPQCVLALLSGLLRNATAMRDVETFSSVLRLGGRGKGISDGALTHLLAKASGDTFVGLLVQSVRDMFRRNELRPDGLGQHWTTIDGKYSCYDHSCGGLAQMFQGDGKVWWRLGTLRAMLVSSADRVMLGWHVMPPKPGSLAAAEADAHKHTGETTNLLPFIENLRAWYGDLCCNFTVDAGLWSKALFEAFDRNGWGIFAGLKSNRGDVYGEAERLLRIERHRSKPLAQSDWEPHKGNLIQRRLWRTTALDGWLGWNHLRQVVLVEQTTTDGDGNVLVVEDRYFATNATIGMLQPSQALLLVRRHWGVENDGNWTFDMQFGEDDGAWCTQNFAALALATLRMIAYNLMQRLRKSHVRVLPVRQRTRAKSQPRAWRNLADLLRDALRTGAPGLSQQIHSAQRLALLAIDEAPA